MNELLNLLAALWASASSLSTGADKMQAALNSEGMRQNTALAAGNWTHFGGSATRNSVTTAGPTSILAPGWSLPIEPAAWAGWAVFKNIAVGTGVHNTSDRVFAVETGSGQLLWEAPLPPKTLESWSTPVIDVQHSTAIVASGAALVAFDLRSGDVAWQTLLAKPVVNASPLVTADLGACDRLFITDYTGFGASNGLLYCVNIDPYNATKNPFQLGEIVWAAIIGASSGNTPAYLDGVVYTASRGYGEDGPGWIQAFQANATTTPEPLWSFENVIDAGFYGGLTVVDSKCGRHVYAASYNFYGDSMSSNIVKVDAHDGRLIDSAPCNRTSSTPVVLPNKKVLVTGGLHGYGTRPTVQCFENDCDDLRLMWDSAKDTWSDLNGNGKMDPGEYLLVGGWSTLPIAVRQPGGGFDLFVGLVPDSPFQVPYQKMFRLDLEKHPTSRGFVKQETTTCGSTPAITGNRLVSTGMFGLIGF